MSLSMNFDVLKAHIRAGPVSLSTSWLWVRRALGTAPAPRLPLATMLLTVMVLDSPLKLLVIFQLNDFF